MAYADIEALKLYLKLPPLPGNSPSTAEDELLEELLARAQQRIDTHCNQTFEAAEDSTRYFVPLGWEDGGAVDGLDLVLDAPLAQLTEVVNGDGAVLAASNYQLLPINELPKYAVRLKRSSGVRWTHGGDAESDLIAVTGRWAYSVEAPADIAHACVRLAAWYYRQRANANDLDRTVITAGQTILPSRIPGDVMDTLNDGYVRMVMSGLGG